MALVDGGPDVASFAADMHPCFDLEDGIVCEAEKWGIGVVK